MAGAGIIIPEVTPLPGLDKFGPGEGVQDVLWRNLALIIVFLSALSQIGAGRFVGVGGQPAGENSPFGSAVVLARYFDVVIGYGSIEKIPVKLFAGRSGSDEGRG